MNHNRRRNITPDFIRNKFLGNESGYLLKKKKKKPELMLRLWMEFLKIVLVISKKTIKDGFMSFI